MCLLSSVNWTPIELSRVSNPWEYAIAIKRLYLQDTNRSLDRLDKFGYKHIWLLCPWLGMYQEKAMPIFIRVSVFEYIWFNLIILLHPENKK